MRYYSAPGGSLVTSVCSDDDHAAPGQPGGVSLNPVPRPLLHAAFRFGQFGFDMNDVHEVPEGLVTEGGLTWRRFDVVRIH